MDLFIACVFINLLMLWIMVPCNVGSKIEANCNMLMNILFDTDWIDSDLEHKKNIVIMQTIMQVNPIKVKAGVFYVDLENSLKLINAAYSFVAILRRMKKTWNKKSHFS